MAEVIERPRNGCALHGAVSTVGEINGAVPIVHSNAGCAIQNYLASKASSAGRSPMSGFSIPGTAVSERHVIFGGASRLREQIKNTLKVIDGDLYVVLNGCESAMVGDDIDAMTKESFEQGEPVLDSGLVGFHGSEHLGYSQVMTDIIQKLPEINKNTVRKNNKLVNVLGILPQHDIFFKGELSELKRLLMGAGLEVNTFFGAFNGVEELVKAAGAAATLVFSKWGDEPAQSLLELYRIPVIRFEGIPTGYDEVADMIGKAAKAAGIEREEYQDFLNQEKAKFDYFLERIAEELYEENMPGNIAIVGDERIVCQISVFFTKYLAARINTIIITDFVQSENIAEQEEKERLSSLAEKVYLSADSREIEQILLQSKADVILGSSLEEQTAVEKQAIFIPISYPVYHRTILNKSYIGISGALSMAEDYITKVKEYNRRRNEQLHIMLSAEQR